MPDDGAVAKKVDHKKIAPVSLEVDRKLKAFGLAFVSKTVVLFLAPSIRVPRVHETTRSVD